MFRRPLLAATLAAATLTLAACQDSTPKTSLGGVPFGNYVLVGMDGAAVPLRNVTLNVQEKRLSGQGPCNGYTTPNSAELPALALAPLTTTYVACDKATFEQRFFHVMQTATEVEYYGGVLKVKAPSTWLIFERGTTDTSGVNALEAARGQQ
ncbi:META domain-containing protein [Paracoccus caeni]|uniref:META domain-containing protein n=1 Tax=Paracoccus caeni TaxID=657651 RepID=A0A934SJN8_9RHOB|nr:META domain-containing protein [Paracoccus caeni]MBK4216562.1 META domain-containing protein [Paracoccus caeni]